MSWLSKLGKGLAIGGSLLPIPGAGALAHLGTIGKVVGAAAKAAPAMGAVGNAIGKAAPVAGAIGSVASGAANGAAERRLAEGNQALGYADASLRGASDKATQDRANAQAQYDAAMRSAEFSRDNAKTSFDASMRGAEFNRTGQDRARSNALRAQTLGNLQDVNISGMNPKIAARTPTISGGLRPSVLTNNNSALMAQLQQPEINAPTFEMPGGELPSYLAPSPYVAPNIPTAPKAGMGENILGGIGLGGSILGAIGSVANGFGGGEAKNHTMPVPQQAQAPSLDWMPTSPQLLPIDEQQDAWMNPDLLDPTQQKDPYAGVRF